MLQLAGRAEKLPRQTTRNPENFPAYDSDGIASLPLARSANSRPVPQHPMTLIFRQPTQSVAASRPGPVVCFFAVKEIINNEPFGGLFAVHAIVSPK